LKDQRDVPWTDDEEYDYTHRYTPITEISFEEDDEAQSAANAKNGAAGKHPEKTAKSAKSAKTPKTPKTSGKKTAGKKAAPAEDALLTEEPAPKRKMSLKNKILGPFLGTVTLVLIIVCCVMAAQRTKLGNVYYYIEGGELYRSTGAGKGTRISSGFIAGAASASPSVAKTVSAELLPKIFESSDGRYIFYPDNNSVTGAEGTYFCRKTNGSGSALRVDSGIAEITLAEKGATVLYKKGTAFYRFSPKGGSELLCADIAKFCGSETFEIVYYIDNAGTLFLKNGSSATEPVEKDVTSVGCVSTSGTVWFVKNSVLYRKTLGGDKQKICSDAYGDGFVLTGKLPDFYFLTYKSSNIDVTDLIEDALREYDAGMAEPVKPVAPERSSYPTENEYKAALAVYEKDAKEYPALEKSYTEKLARDKIRAAAESDRIERKIVTLNYCDGEKITPVAENIFAKNTASEDDPYYALYEATGLADGPLDNGRGTVVFLKIKDSAMPSAPIDAFSDYESLREYLTARLAPSCVLEAARGTDRMYTEAGDVSGVTYSSNGSYFYYFANKGFSTEGYAVYDLHRIDVKKFTDTVVDAKVSDRYFNPDQCVYFKEPRAGFTLASLYKNGKRISEKAIPESVKAAGSTVCFFTEFSGDTGTLSVHNGKKISATVSGVSDFTVTRGGTVVYIGDYHGPGDNTLFFGTGSKEVTKNVSSVR